MVELVDVPAAVVCTVCGSSDCAGCADEEVRTRSGLVVFVPWERAQLGLWARFWQTTRATTQGAEAFFGAIPAGPIQSALTYAVVAEALAVGTTTLALGAALTAAAAVAVPSVVAWALRDPAARHAILRASVAAVAGFSLVLVAAHAVHGAMLHRAATRAGKKGDGRRSLRFGLYAAGWDVVTSPFGMLVIAVTSGLGAIAEVRGHALKTPTLATTAMLRGLYGSTALEAKAIRARAMLGTMAFSVVAVVVALALIVLAALT